MAGISAETWRSLLWRFVFNHLTQLFVYINCVSVCLPFFKGTILDEYTVLSAAHCFRYSGLSGLAVVTGTVNRQSATAQVSNFFRTPTNLYTCIRPNSFGT